MSEQQPPSPHPSAATAGVVAASLPPLNNGIVPGHHSHVHNGNPVGDAQYNYHFVTNSVPSFDFNDPVALNLIREQVSHINF